MQTQSTIGRQHHPNVLLRHSIHLVWRIMVLLLLSMSLPVRADPSDIALLQAIKKGDNLAAIDALKQGANPNIKDRETGLSALLLTLNHRDAQGSWQPPHDNPELVQALLEHHAVVDVRDKDGFTPLIFAALHNLEKTVRLLLDKGADVNAQNDQGWTALMCAINRINLVKILIDRGANVNAADKDGQTVLIWSVTDGTCQTMQCLIDAGASLNARNNHGWTALHIALTYRFTDSSDSPIYQKKEKVRLLRKKGAKE